MRTYVRVEPRRARLRSLAQGTRPAGSGLERTPSSCWSASDGHGDRHLISWGRALDQHDHRSLAIAGFAFAIASLLLSVYVLAPKADLDFALSGPRVYEHFAEQQADLDEVKRTLAYWNQGAYDGNQEVVDALIRWFRRAIGALVLAVAFWSLGLTLN
jgi:hypothetical protein